ncbi:MAG TPA: PadR family transcriptional regulator [Casimicrobiaceae bacterium]|jgi:DNA-binding PadR family transcriptional regulator|nr:PadR family transcriptional regulator [Casimicrobiaceae bacterium]
MHRYFRDHGDYCGGRHTRRHGLGGLFGAVVGGHGFGWHGFRAGRKLGGDDLQLVVLALLADRPYHGYEIMKALEERSGGFYSPSPGMVYPALTYLEEIGYASVEAEGAKKLYRITEEGRAHLEQNRRVVDAIFAQLAWVGDKMEHVRRVFAGDETRAGEERRRGWSAELNAARRAVREALAAKVDASEEEQRRVAEILERAAKEIGGK